MERLKKYSLFIVIFFLTVILKRKNYLLIVRNNRFGLQIFTNKSLVYNVFLLIYIIYLRLILQ